MAYLYRHIRLDKNEPFYIGVGSDEVGKYKRAYNIHNRSKFWKNIISKTKYEVEIVLDNITWEEACQKEIEFIKLYGRAELNNGGLVNLTDGGEGFLGYIKTESQKEHLSKVLTGKPKHNEEQKQKWRETRKGKPNPNGGGKNKKRPKTSVIHKGRISPNKGKGKQVSLYKITGEYIKTYNNYHELAHELNINPETVRCQLIGKAKTICNKKYKAEYL